MKLIKIDLLKARYHRASNSAKKWRDTYYRNNKWYIFLDGRSAERIWFGLISLGKNPDPDKIDKLIGNSSWTQPNNYYICKNCEKNVEYGVCIKEEISLCDKCIKKCLCIIKRYKK